MNPAEPTLADIQDIRDAIRALVAEYFAALDQNNQSPLFSLRPYLTLLFQTLFWELAILPALFLAVINGAIFVVAAMRGKPPAYWGLPVLRFVAKPFVALHRADLSGLRIADVRYLTKLLLLVHFRRRVRLVEGLLERLDIAVSLEAEPEPALAGRIAALKETQEKVRHRLESQVGLSDLLWISPVFAVLGGVSGKVAKWIGDSQQMKDLLAWLGARHVGAPGGLFDQQVYDPALYIFAVLTTFFLLAVSSFNDKRLLLQTRGVYAHERMVLARLGLRSPAEFPLDICALAIWVLVLAGLALFNFPGFVGAMADLMDQKPDDLGSLGIGMLAILGYLFWRRAQDDAKS